MKKIVILGPESTGKSELAEKLAEYYNGCLVTEFAREYLNELSREYLEEDLLEIAKGQVRREEEVTDNCKKKDGNIIFFDTDLTVMKIWSEYKFGNCDHWILEHYKQREYDFYLLTYPDLVWEQDPLRENPDDREEIFDIYEADLRSRKVPYKVIKGEGALRIQRAIDAIEDQFG